MPAQAWKMHCCHSFFKAQQFRQQLHMYPVLVPSAVLHIFSHYRGSIVLQSWKQLNRLQEHKLSRAPAAAGGHGNLCFMLAHLGPSFTSSRRRASRVSVRKFVFFPLKRFTTIWQCHDRVLEVVTVPHAHSFPPTRTILLSHHATIPPPLTLQRWYTGVPKMTRRNVVQTSAKRKCVISFPPCVLTAA